MTCDPCGTCTAHKTATNRSDDLNANDGISRIFEEFGERGQDLCNIRRELTTKMLVEESYLLGGHDFRLRRELVVSEDGGDGNERLVQGRGVTMSEDVC